MFYTLRKKKTKRIKFPGKCYQAFDFVRMVFSQTKRNEEEIGSIFLYVEESSEKE